VIKSTVERRNLSWKDQVLRKKASLFSISIGTVTSVQFQKSAHKTCVDVLLKSAEASHG
jgi:hypothetical protein